MSLKFHYCNVVNIEMCSIPFCEGHEHKAKVVIDFSAIAIISLPLIRSTYSHQINFVLKLNCMDEYAQEVYKY